MFYGSALRAGVAFSMKFFRCVAKRVLLVGALFGASAHGAFDFGCVDALRVELRSDLHLVSELGQGNQGRAFLLRDPHATFGAHDEIADEPRPAPTLILPLLYGDPVSRVIFESRADLRHKAELAREMYRLGERAQGVVARHFGARLLVNDIVHYNEPIVRGGPRVKVTVNHVIATGVPGSLASDGRIEFFLSWGNILRDEFGVLTLLDAR